MNNAVINLARPEQMTPSATLMVVDDTPANLILLEQMLKNHGYRVLAFPKGSMALRAAAKSPPDLILLDIMMPELNGFEVCQQLKADAALKDIPVIFISALSETPDKIKAFTAGGVDYVTKPFQEEEVLARVGAHLRLRQQQVQIEAQKEQLQQGLECLQELERLRDSLVHMLVHDMRSPLMGISGYAEILEIQLNRAGQTGMLKSVQEILLSCKNLENLISTILDISRLEARQMPLHPESCDLRDIIAQALASMGALTQKTTVIWEPPAEARMSHCDPDITRRIVENLIANAIKFTGSEGRVTITTAPVTEGLKICVQDTGAGIPAEELDHIFEKFGQVRIRQKGIRSATGLGLTFCKLAVEAQGGRIGVESVVKEGSIFWLVLPQPVRQV